MSEEELSNIINNLPEEYQMKGDDIKTYVSQKEDGTIIILRKTNDDYQVIQIKDGEVSVKSKKDIEEEQEKNEELNSKTEGTSDSSEYDGFGGSGGGGGYDGTYTQPPMLNANNFFDHIGNIGDSQDFVYQDFYSAMKTAEDVCEAFNRSGSSLSVETGGLDIDLSGVDNCRTCIGKACGIGASQNLADLVSTFHAINDVVIANNEAARLYYQYNESRTYSDMEDFGEFGALTEEYELSEEEAKIVQDMCEDAMKGNKEKLDNFYEQIDNLSIEKDRYEEIYRIFGGYGPIGSFKDDETGEMVFSLDAFSSYVEINYPGISKQLIDEAKEHIDKNGNVKYDEYINATQQDYNTKIAEAYTGILTTRTSYNLNLGAYCNLYMNYDDFAEESVSKITQEMIDNGESNGLINPLNINLFYVLNGEQANFDKDYLNYASDNQVKITQYMVNTGNGEQYLNQYLGILQDNANQIKAAEAFKEFVDNYYKSTNIALDSDGNPIRDANGQLTYDESNKVISPGFLGEVKTKEGLGLPTLALEGLGDGLQGFADGITSLINAKDDVFVTGESVYKQAMVIDFLSELYGADTVKNAITSGTYEISSSIGNMIPSLVASVVAGALFTPAVGSAVGSTLLGASAAGNSMVEGYNSGMDEKTAKMYGIMSGLSEGGLEYLLGGITGLSMPKEGVSFLHNLISEGAEESIQEILGAALLNASLGYEAVTVDTEQVLKAGIYGMITAGLIDGSVTVAKDGALVLANGLIYNKGVLTLGDGTVISVNELNDFIRQSDANQIDQFFKEHKNFGNYGVNQGYNTLLWLTNPKEHARLKNELIERGFSARDASKILSGMDSTGICTYAAIANGIVNIFKDTPELFKEKFGFDLYKTSNGKQTINSGELLMDMYLYFNDKSNGGRLFTTDANGNKVLDDKNFLGRMKTKDQVYIDPDDSILTSYFRSKGIDSSVRSNTLFDTYNPYSGYRKINSDKALLNLESRIVDALQKNHNLNMDIIGGKGNSPIFMIPLDITMPIPVSTLSMINSGHAIYITGCNEKGLYVSSWGGKYFIPFSNLKGGAFSIEEWYTIKSRENFAKEPLVMDIDSAVTAEVMNGNGSYLAAKDRIQHFIDTGDVSQIVSPGVREALGKYSKDEIDAVLNSYEISKDINIILRETIR